MADGAFEEFEPIQYPRDRHRKSHRFTLYVSVILIIIATIFLGFNLYQNLPDPKPQTQSPCGNSTAQARRNGCEFDFTSYAWLPRECVDVESNEKYRQWMNKDERVCGAFPLFRDREGKDRIESEEELAERVEKGVFLTREAHWGHCLLMSQKLLRARNKGTTIHRTAVSMKHMEHCTNIIVNIDNVDPDPTLDSFGKLDPVSLGFGSCIRI